MEIRKRKSQLKCLFVIVLLISSIFVLYNRDNRNRTIVVITATNRQMERLADLMRFSQTLMHIKNVRWIVVENGTTKVPAVERLLKRSRIPHEYLTYQQNRELISSWSIRWTAVKRIRKNVNDYAKDSIVLFADAETSYDLRFFDSLVRRVDSIGIWPVGLVDGKNHTKAEDAEISIAEMRSSIPVHVSGFAIRLSLLLNAKPQKERQCMLKKNAPKVVPCILKLFNQSKIKTMGTNQEVLIWHTESRGWGKNGGTHGYVIEKTV
ncbi:Galactosylgalactosylxylosylprotein 3-beta-glucuronosyltransferase [Aphelenchoides besseyi]|nr:Galactosylgalactosylxylosylprotein 3-beta-glucuronosyltransferase [Aphelenchoides besseyi]KAI6212115.1 Galactosylgalactosylxylosylprotein 3-beta-glucuronosyltransferase [Aphelenchoides besseyi]